VSDDTLSGLFDIIYQTLLFFCLKKRRRKKELYYKICIYFILFLTEEENLPRTSRQLLAELRKLSLYLYFVLE